MGNKKVVEYVQKAIDILADERYQDDKFTHACGYKHCVVGWMANFGCEASREVVDAPVSISASLPLEKKLGVTIGEFNWLFNIYEDDLTREQTIEYLQLVVDNDGDIKAAMEIWGEHYEHLIED